ncbi:hypothetical protein C0J45_3478 [Silurus meridionalis]|nr:hypothetical protein C0J45_3478 [Silurus meridionalis]
MAAARNRTGAQKKRRQQVAAASRGRRVLHNMRERRNRKAPTPDCTFGLFASPAAAACKKTDGTPPNATAEEAEHWLCVLTTRKCAPAPRD